MGDIASGAGAHGQSCLLRRFLGGGSQGILWVSPTLEWLQVARNHKLMGKKNFQAATPPSTEDKLCFDYGHTHCHKLRCLEEDTESIIMSYQKLAMRIPGC